MRRFLITNQLKKAIKERKDSLSKISNLLDFEIRNILYKNKTINENHLKKLNEFLDFNQQLQEIEMNYEKNLGILSSSPNPKLVKRDEDLAEFIGIMLGDGCMWKNQLTISLDKRNTTYINYVKNLFKRIFGIELRFKIDKGTNTGHLYYYNKKLIEILINFGLKRGNKIVNQVGIPNWIKQDKVYMKFCIRGLIDTDGCIYRCKREEQIYVKFTNNNQRLLDDFKELSLFLGYSFAKSNKYNWTLYRKREVEKFFKDIKPIKLKGAVGKPGYPFRFGT